MKSKESYTSPEEFMMDEAFRQWVLFPQDELNRFWKTWIDGHPNQVQHMLIAKELILKLEFKQKEFSQQRNDRVLQKVLAGKPSRFSLETKKQSFVLRVVGGIAAMLAITFFLYLFKNDPDQQREQTRQFVVKQNPKGRKSRLKLPDGSQVWLNAASSISYSKGFNDQVRSVQLDGEAYFEVAKDLNRPFVVSTRNMQVTALGTAFNINNYEFAPMEQVTLTEGKVKVQIAKSTTSNDEIYLVAGEALSLERESGSHSKFIFDKDKELGWKEGILILKDATMSTTIIRLECWYGVNIQVIDEVKAGEWNFSAAFDNESLETVLNTIAYAKGFTYTMEKDEVTITF